MPYPLDPDDDSDPPRFRSALRYLIAGAIGGATALGIFATMAWTFDVSSIVMRMFRIFPLIQTSLEGEGACDESDLWQAVIIEGAVGTLRNGELQALPGASAEGRDGSDRVVPIDIAADGSFRYVAAFPNEAPTTCDRGERSPIGPPPTLVVRAPGCAERVVPITRAWVPHAISLDCSSGS